MTLLTDLPKLREMEHSLSDPAWNMEVYAGIAWKPVSPDREEYNRCVIAASQAMLSVLECFREGDADRMAWMLSETKDNGSDIRKMIERLQRAASFMEDKGDEL